LYREHSRQLFLPKTTTNNLQKKKKEETTHTLSILACLLLHAGSLEEHIRLRSVAIKTPQNTIKSSARFWQANAKRNTQNRVIDEY